MRKFIALAVMITVCSIYFIAMKGKGDATVANLAKNQVSVRPSKVVEEIGCVIAQIESDYPKIPKEVVEMHDQLMLYQYGEDVAEVVVDETLRGIRMFYSEALLALNPIETQKALLMQELQHNETNQVYMISSKVKTIEFPTPEHAWIEVSYNTTEGEQMRQYELIKEEDQWKIISWLNLQPSTEGEMSEE